MPGDRGSACRRIDEAGHTVDDLDACPSLRGHRAQEPRTCIRDGTPRGKQSRPWAR